LLLRSTEAKLLFNRFVQLRLDFLFSFLVAEILQGVRSQERERRLWLGVVFLLVSLVSLVFVL
jgi:hypothetical protein